MIKKDIQDAEDLYNIVSLFYNKLLSDESIKHLFEEVVEHGLEEHLQNLVAFWDQMLFGNFGYEKNVMQLHLKKNSEMPFTEENFKTWLSHFNASIEELHEGIIAENMKDRAYSIAYIMRTKILK